VRKHSAAEFLLPVLRNMLPAMIRFFSEPCGILNLSLVHN